MNRGAEHRAVNPGVVRCGCIVLAGGRGSRMGGVFKAGISIGGRTVLSEWLDALRADHGLEGINVVDIVVVGPSNLVDRFHVRTDGGSASGIEGADRTGLTHLHPGLPMRSVSESPAFGGPAAGVVAGIGALRPCDAVMVVSADSSGDTLTVVKRLLRGYLDLGELQSRRAGVVGTVDGRGSWTLSIWDRDEIRLSDVRNMALRVLLPVGDSNEVPLDGLVFGLNTVSDLLECAERRCGTGPISVRLVDCRSAEHGFAPQAGADRSAGGSADGATVSKAIPRESVDSVTMAEVGGARDLAVGPGSGPGPVRTGNEVVPPPDISTIVVPVISVDGILGSRGQSES